MSTEIENEIKKRGISRLCHFTPSRNLQHIASGKKGILSTASLLEDERATFNATDLNRHDQKTTHICCSIEYPNAWYFDKARTAERIFPDWVILLIDPKYLLEPNVLFFPRNAAANYGSHAREGADGLLAMFAPQIVGAYGRSFDRLPARLPSCPTDEQAEVLIPDRILPGDILGVAVISEEQGRTEQVRLRTIGVNPNEFHFVVAPVLFSKYALSAAIKQGSRPVETVLSNL